MAMHPKMYVFSRVLATSFAANSVDCLFRGALFLAHCSSPYRDVRVGKVSFTLHQLFAQEALKRNIARMTISREHLRIQQL
jgi:hypothetical protein